MSDLQGPRFDIGGGLFQSGVFMAEIVVERGHVAPPGCRANLRKKLWAAWKLAPRPVPKAKELKECFAFHTRTERLFRTKELIIDCAGGHGALGMAFKLHQRSAKVIIGDLHTPDSFFTLQRVWFSQEEISSGHVEHKKVDIRDRGWLLRLLYAEQVAPEDCAVVGCHVCNALTDELMDECLGAHVEFAIMGCCHGRTGSQGRASKDSAKELGVSLGTLVDMTRLGVIMKQDGFIAKLRTIDANITPENRILIGLYEDANVDGSAADQTKKALGKVARVYDRVFSKQSFSHDVKAE